MINFSPRSFKSYIARELTFADNDDQKNTLPKKKRKQAPMQEMILSANSRTSPYYYADSYIRGDISAKSAVKSYAYSNIPFYSYYTLYEKIRHKEVSRGDAIKAFFLSTLANLS